MQVDISKVPSSLDNNDEISALLPCNSIDLCHLVLPWNSGGWISLQQCSTALAQFRTVCIGTDLCHKAFARNSKGCISMEKCSAALARCCVVFQKYMIV